MLSVAQVSRAKPIAFVPQQPWVFNATTPGSSHLLACLKPGLLERSADSMCLLPKQISTIKLHIILERQVCTLLVPKFQRDISLLNFFRNMHGFRGSDKTSSLGSHMPRQSSGLFGQIIQLVSRLRVVLSTAPQNLYRECLRSSDLEEAGWSVAESILAFGRA